MSSSVERYLPYFEVLKTANPALRKAFIKESEPGFIDAICEICYNYIQGNISCDKSQYSALAKHRALIRKLVDLKKKNKNKKLHRKVLLQSGDGFWFALLAPLLTELTSFIVSKALQK